MGTLTLMEPQKMLSTAYPLKWNCHMHCRTRLRDMPAKSATAGVLVIRYGS